MIILSDMARSAFLLATRFWSWWITELISCVPQRFQHLIPKPKPKIFWHVKEELLEIEGRKFPFDSQFSGCPVILDFSRIAHRYEIPMPNVRRSQLKGAVSLQLDRHIPWAPEDVWFDCVPCLDKPESTEILVIPKIQLLQCVEGAAARGLVPTKGVIRASVRSPQVSVPIFGNATTIRSIVSFPNALILVSILLFFGLVSSIEARRMRNTDALRALSMEARENALITQSLQEELSRLDSRDTYLAERASDWPPLEIIALLGSALPEDAWIEELSLTGNEISLLGYADNVDVVYRMLEEEIGIQNLARGELDIATRRKAADMRVQAFRITGALRMERQGAGQ